MTGQPCQHFHKHWDNKTSPKAKLMGARRLTDRRGVRRKSKSQMPLRLYPSRLVSARRGIKMQSHAQDSTGTKESRNQSMPEAQKLWILYYSIIPNKY